ncbi:uncharacterized protein ARB_03006 [Trichophyton benhamiae CBS 112371]|uniref:Uncharacterized protein n=1 Tax=Arthroderma benhamiae (strain ATCC MYA-4681 / CBS 112371) TaxID=663331 RepID=D4B3G8_ARTBC|nr:uncharacterized protein ARB_03006 [Trichophyton benhamiae CBS 112371]EFE29666.1 conserved hypothetical protein [Trichophyton benhamiae CBS 112371]
MGHSITWEYSEESEAEEMVSRCSYCGRFCNKRAIHGKTGLCYPCRETLRKEGDKRALETDSDTESASSGRGAEECEPVKGHPAATAEAEDDSQSAKSEEGTARSNPWPSLCVVCLLRVRFADMVPKHWKEWMKGTKKRFQPPNPHLQAGKRLTRVCDSCRQKRKRCEHRRVVDATDPEAHCRKRGRKRKCEEISEDKKESESNNAPTRREEEQDVLIDILSFFFIAFYPAEIIVVDDPAEEPGCSDESMNHAIKESLDTVYKRELLKLEAIANEKVDEANKALDAVRDYLRSWLEHVRRGNSLGKQQLPEQPEKLDPLEQQDQPPQPLQPPEPTAQEECV